MPASRFDLEQLDAIRDGDGKALRTRITLDRSSKLHRWYWVFIGVVADAIEMPVKALHIALKAKAGLVDGIITGAAGVSWIIQSTRHDVMGDDEFRPYVRQAVDIVFRDYLTADTRSDVLKRVNEMVGGVDAAPPRSFR